MSRLVAVPGCRASDSRVESHSFLCTIRPGDIGPAWVHVGGELDIVTAPRLEQALRRAELVACLTVLDLRQLTFIDSSGVHVIVRAALRARRRKRRLVVLRGPSQVERLLAVSGASERLDVVDLDPPEPPHDAPPALASGTV